MLRAQVHTKADGYLVLVSFGPTFSIALQDLQLIADVNPLRIDSISVRSAENAISESSSVNSGSSGGIANPTTYPHAAATADHRMVGAVIAVKILDGQQAIRITEAEIVRVKKRHRGWFTRAV